MNPYASQLGGRDAMQVLAATPGQAEELAHKLGPSGMQRSLAPGKWTAAQILCHLADCEIAFGFRLRQIAARPGHQIQVFDQDAWAWPYAALDGNSAVEAFRAARKWNLLWLMQVTPERLTTPAFHPERGSITLQEQTGTMAGHDLHHLLQLETLLFVSGYKDGK